MNHDKWLNEIKKEFKVDATVENTDKDFFKWIINISDSQHNGASFQIAFNSEDNASMLDMDDFEFRRLNIAEGYTSDEIIEVARLILNGSFKVKRTFLSRKSKVCFSVNNTIVCAKARSNQPILPKLYEALYLKHLIR